MKKKLVTAPFEIVPLTDAPHFTDDEIKNGVKRRWENSTFVYLMRNLRNGFVKIGRTQNPKYREKTLQSEEPEIVFLFAYRTDPHMERELHAIFSSQRQRGEWFRLSGDDVEIARRALRDMAAELDGRLMAEVLADYVQ